MTGAPVFIDRDGTIVPDPPPGYLKNPDTVTLFPGVARAIARVNRAGRPVLVITNQAGIARGLLTEADYNRVNARVVELLAAEGAHWDGIYMCPHAPEISGPCECRKPGPLLYTQASQDHQVGFADAWYVGDRIGDLLASETLGGRGILVETGEGPRYVDEARAKGFKVVADVAAAVDVILGQEPR